MRITMQNFARGHVFEVNEISIEFSRQIDVKTGLENLERFKYKSVTKSHIKAL